MGCAPSAVRQKNVLGTAAVEVKSTGSMEAENFGSGSTLTGEEEEDGTFFKGKNNQEILQIVTELSKKALADGKLMTGDGELKMEAAHALFIYNRAFFHLHYIKSATKDDVEKFREKLAKVALDTKFFSAISDTILDLFEKGCAISNGMFSSLFFLYCQSYCSDDFVDSLVKAPNLLETIKKIMKDHKETLLAEEKKYSFLAQLSEACLGVLDYVAMKDQIARLTDLDLLDTLKPYLTSGIKKQRLMTLMVVSVIISEGECEILTTHPEIIKYLLSDAKRRLDNDRKKSGDFSCYECAFVIHQLARNDENKKLLVELGALPILVRIGDTAEEDVKEKYEVVHSIWALSFDKQNAKLIANNQNLGVVELLLKLKDTGDSRIQKACNGALWTLRDALLNSKINSYRNLGKKFEPDTDEKKNKQKTEVEQKGGHIMVSYQWADQQILKVIRDKLKAHNFKVWMDIDEMGGSTLQAMAEAVEDADIVLMCMSQKYKNSSNCRAEAEYAFQKKKVIIPLKMERGYVPDGWLGFICGAKVFFEFTDKYPFEEKMSGLLKEVSKVFGKSHEAGIDKVDGMIVPVAQPQTRAEPRVSSARLEAASAPMTSHFKAGSLLDTISGWSQSECTGWVSKNDLKSCGLDSMGGKEIALLLSMWLRAPEAYYKCLHHTLNIKDFKVMAKLEFAIRQLATKDAGVANNR